MHLSILHLDVTQTVWLKSSPIYVTYQLPVLAVHLQADYSLAYVQAYIGYVSITCASCTSSG